MVTPCRCWTAVAIAALTLMFSPRIVHGDVGEQAIAYGNVGIKIGDEPIFTGDVEFAAWDPAQELIWFKSKGTLYVIDLRSPKRKAVPIAKKMPAGGFGISGVSNASSPYEHGHIHPIIVVGKKPKVILGERSTNWDHDDDTLAAMDRADRKRIEKVKIVGKKWIKAQAKREPRAVPAPTSSDVVGKVAVPADVCSPGGVEACGEARAFGTTGYQLVVVGDGCGFDCCVLYDPIAEKYNSLDHGGDWTAEPGDGTDCAHYQLSPSGTSYVQGWSRCDIGTTISCSSSYEWFYIGWVEGSVATATTANTATATSTTDGSHGE